MYAKRRRGNLDPGNRAAGERPNAGPKLCPTREKQRAKAAAAAKAAQKKAEAAAKAEAKKRAADPAYAAAQEERERRQAAAGIVVLGALLGALAGAGSDSFESADATEDDVAERIRMRSQYYRDRAEREAAFGDYNAARSSLEMAK